MLFQEVSVCTFGLFILETSQYVLMKLCLPPASICLLNKYLLEEFYGFDIL